MPAWFSWSMHTFASCAANTADLVPAFLFVFGILRNYFQKNRVPSFIKKKMDAILRNTVASAFNQ